MLAMSNMDSKSNVERGPVEDRKETNGCNSVAYVAKHELVVLMTDEKGSMWEDPKE